MLEQFYDAGSIIYGILKALLLVIIGYALYSRKILKKEGVEGLNDILLWAALPALIFSKTVEAFSPSAYRLWWVLPICSMAMSFLGAGLGYLGQRLLPDFRAGKEYMCSCAFQNAGYLPMALTAFICSGTFCDEILVYIFLFLIGFNLLMWSFMPAFLSRDKAFSVNLRSFVNPPLIATVLALVSVYIFGKGWLPGIINDPMKLLGDMTFPLALITLGAYLAEYKGHKPGRWAPILSAAAIKMVLVPIVVFSILILIRVDMSFKFFLFLESTMPTAVTLVVIGHYKKADNKFFSGVIFYTYLLGIVTIPVALWVFRAWMR